MTTTIRVLRALRDHYQQLADSGVQLSFASFDEAAKHAIKLLIASFISRMPLSTEQLVSKFFDAKTLRYWRHQMAVKYRVEEKLIDNTNVYLFLTVIAARSFFDRRKFLKVCAIMPDATEYKGTFTQTVLRNEAEFDTFQEEYVKLNAFLQYVSDSECQKITVLPAIHLEFSKELTQQLLDSIYLSKSVKIYLTDDLERLDYYDLVRTEKWLTQSTIMEQIGMYEADEEFRLTGECDETEQPLRPIRDDEDRIAYILHTKLIEHITLKEDSTAFLDRWYSLNHDDNVLCRAAALLETQVLCERADADNGLSGEEVMLMSDGAIKALNEECFTKYIILGQLRERANDEEQYPEIQVLYNSICKKISFDENLIDPAVCLFEGIMKFVTDNSKTKSYTQVCNAYSNEDIFTACQALKYYRGDEVYHAIHRRAMAKQQKGFQKAYGATAMRQQSVNRSTRNYVSANKVTQSATRNYVSANKVTQSANNNRYKAYTASSDIQQHIPKSVHKSNTDSIEHEFMIYTSINPVSLLLTDNAVYKKLRQEYNKLQMCINSAYSRMYAKDPEEVSKAKKEYEDLRLKQCRARFDMYMHEIKAVSHALDVSWDDEAIINAARKFTIKDYTKVIGTNVVVEFKDEILKFSANEVTQSATRNYVSANDNVVITIDI